ncbi:hypothetical protein IPP75_04580 [Candidatus Saccharibacteria bacterium]|nr:MAG: hypothetical protein IPP75_04580 [Candidatus Saccharibacteria bacterium]
MNPQTAPTASPETTAPTTQASGPVMDVVPPPAPTVQTPPPSTGQAATEAPVQQAPAAENTPVAEAPAASEAAPAPDMTPAAKPAPQAAPAKPKPPRTLPIGVIVAAVIIFLALSVLAYYVYSKG